MDGLYGIFEVIRSIIVSRARVFMNLLKFNRVEISFSLSLFFPSFIVPVIFHLNLSVAIVIIFFLECQTDKFRKIEFPIVQFQIRCTRVLSI